MSNTMGSTGRAGRNPDFLLVGTDTFRGTGRDSTLMRATLYSKNEGSHEVSREGLQRTESAVSGSLLASRLAVARLVTARYVSTDAPTRLPGWQAPGLLQPDMFLQMHPPGFQAGSHQACYSQIRDPIAGCNLRLNGDRASVTTPASKQNMAFSKKLYTTKDVDVTIATLRATTKVSRYTNEKVGTAGTPTGLDTRIGSYKE
eukprot:gene20962-27817_t